MRLLELLPEHVSFMHKKSFKLYIYILNHLHANQPLLSHTHIDKFLAI